MIYKRISGCKHLWQMIRVLKTKLFLILKMPVLFFWSGFISSRQGSKVFASKLYNSAPIEGTIASFYENMKTRLKLLQVWACLKERLLDFNKKYLYSIDKIHLGGYFKHESQQNTDPQIRFYKNIVFLKGLYTYFKLTLDQKNL